MSDYEVTCPYCGGTMRITHGDLARTLPCSSCGKELRFEADGADPGESGGASGQAARAADLQLPLGTYPLAGTSATSAREPPPLPSAPPPLPAAAPVPLPSAPVAPGAPVVRPQQRPLGALPERMKANRLIAGKGCAGCGKVIELGEEAFNCQDCRESMHAACRERLKGCANPQCVSYYASAAPPPILSSARAERGDCPPDSVPCRFCGEYIRKSARKCRFCGEFLDEAERASSRKSVDGDSPSGAEVAFGLVCCGVSFIVGLIFGLMGKKKGWTIMLLGVVSAIIWFIILGIIGSLRR